MNIWTSRVARLALAGALVVATAPLAQAQTKTIKVKGIAFQGPAGPNDGREEGPNYVVSRTLELALYPCGFLPFCPPSDGLFGKVVVNPESVKRIDRGGKWTYHMLAKQVIQAGDVDFRTVPGFEAVGLQQFPTAAIVVGGQFAYVNCTLYQTLVASGDLTQLPGLSITNTFARNVFSVWTIDGGSTCIDASNGRTVTVGGRGTIIFDPANGVVAPSYEGVLTVK